MCCGPMSRGASGLLSPDAMDIWCNSACCRRNRSHCGRPKEEQDFEKFTADLQKVVEAIAPILAPAVGRAAKVRKNGLTCLRSSGRGFDTRNLLQVAILTGCFTKAMFRRSSSI